MIHPDSMHAPLPPQLTLQSSMQPLNGKREAEECRPSKVSCPELRPPPPPLPTLPPVIATHTSDLIAAAASSSSRPTPGGASIHRLPPTAAPPKPSTTRPSAQPLPLPLPYDGLISVHFDGTLIARLNVEGGAELAGALVELVSFLPRQWLMGFQETRKPTMEAPGSMWLTLAEVVPRKARWVDGAKPSVKCKWLFNHIKANPRASEELAVFVLIQKAGSSEFLKGALALRG